MQTLIKTLKELMAIPSPTGYTKKAADYCVGVLKELGFSPVLTRKGCVYCPLTGGGRPLVYAAHLDTLGAMVAGINGSGSLRLTPLGGLNANNTETENFTVFTRFGEKTFTGTLQLSDPSIHVNGDYSSSKRGWDSCELFLDEEVFSAEDTRKLGIAVGDICAPDPRTKVTEKGFIKSRFLDDKLSVAILLEFARRIAAGEVKPARAVALYITVYEEVGHGCASGIPGETEELISVDMGCVGSACDCTEYQVSICCKDSAGPYDYDLTTALIATAKENGIDYAVDVYPHYGSDADAALQAGYDVRHGLVGSGVFASHGYERTHLKGVEATLKLVSRYTERG